MIKKILSLLTLLAIIIGTPVSATASGYTDKSAYAFELLSALSVLDEPANGSAPITRGEFAIYAARLIMGQDEGFDIDQYYSDVISGDEYYFAVGLLANAGVIDKADMFYPNRTILQQEAVKIAVSLLGGDAQANLNGGYYSGYASVAVRMGLLKGLGANAEMSYDDAILLLYNILNCGIGDIRYLNGQSTVTNNNIQPYLTKRFGVYKTNGIINANSATSIDGGRKSAKGYIRIGNTDMRSGVNADDFLGCAVEVFYKYDNARDENTILLVRPTAINSEVSFVSDNAQYSDDQYTYYSDEYSANWQKAVLDRAYTLVYNGRAVEGTLPDPDGIMKRGTIRLLDNNGDGRMDVVFIDSYRHIIVSSYETEKKIVYDKNGNAGIHITDDMDYEIVTEDGNTITFSDITVGNTVLALAESLCGKFIRIVKCHGVISGDVEEIINTTNEITYRISGGLFTAGSELKTALKINDAGNFHLGIDGKIVYYDNTQGRFVYGYLINAAVSNDLAANLQMRVYMENGRLTTYDAKANIIIDGITYKDTTLAVDALKDNGMIQPGIIKIKLSGDYVCEIDTWRQAGAEGDNSFNIIPTTPDPRGVAGYYYYRHPRIFGSRIAFTGATRVFIVPSVGPGFDENKIWVTTGGELETHFRDTSYNITAYRNTKDGLYADAILIELDSLGVGRPHFVERVTTVINEEYGNVHKLYVTNEFGITKEVTTKSLDSIFFTDSNGERAPIEKGDVILYGADINGYTDDGDLLILYDWSTEKFHTESISDYRETTFYSENLIREIWISRVDGDMMQVTVKNPALEVISDNDLYLYPLGGYTLLFFDRESKQITGGSKGEILAYNEVGASCTHAILYSNYYLSGYILIIK